MKLVAIIATLLIGASSIAGEFSKIDLIVRETLERQYQQQSIDFFKDITDLRIEEGVEGCDLVVSAAVLLKLGSVTEMVCLVKDGFDYQGSIL